MSVITSSVTVTLTVTSYSPNCEIWAVPVFTTGVLSSFFAVSFNFKFVFFDIPSIKPVR